MSKLEFSGGGDSGVSIEYVKSRRVLYVGGWYDGGCDIWTGEESGQGIPLAEFLDWLGVTDADVRRSRKEAKS